MRIFFALFLIVLVTLSTSKASIAQQVQFVVEPTMRATAFSSAYLEAGTKIVLKLSGISKNAIVMLQKCSEPCNSAKLIKAWSALNCDLNKAQTVNITERGIYYLWAQTQNGDGSIGPDFYTKPRTEDNKGEFIFQSGGKMVVTMNKP